MPRLPYRSRMPSLWWWRGSGELGQRRRGGHLRGDQEVISAALLRQRRRSRRGDERRIGRPRFLVAKRRRLEQRLPGRVRRLQRRRQPMQRPEAQHAAERAAAAPAARGCDGHEAREVVFVVVDEQAQGAGEVVFDELAEPGFAADDARGRAGYVVAVGEEAGGGGGGGGEHVEDVPDVFGRGEGRPLEGEA